MTQFLLALTFILSGTTFILSGTTFITLSKLDNYKRYKTVGILLTIVGVVNLLIAIFNH